MDRRTALKNIALALGGTFVGAEVLLTGCGPIGDSKYRLSETHIQLLDEVGETIIPATKTPGAKAIGIGAFMEMMVRDTYGPEDQQMFSEGIRRIDSNAQAEFGKAFIQLDDNQRKRYITKLDNEMKAHKGEKAHFFRMIKELTVLGYFTSEPGATEQLRYLETPAKYDACMPYKTGDRVWATT